MIDRCRIGFATQATTVRIDGWRVRLFCLAIGETDEVYWNPAAARAAGHPACPVPPTFLKALEADHFSSAALMQLLGVPLSGVLHAEQGFEHIAPVHVGDDVAISRRVADIHDKKDGALTFIVVDTRYHVGERAAATSRQTIVVRNEAPTLASLAAPRGGACGGPAKPDPRKTLVGSASCGGVAQGVLEHLDMNAIRKQLELRCGPVAAIDLALYAAASGDHNPLHLDESAARGAGFDRPVVHGMLTMAYSARLFTQHFGADSVHALQTRFTGAAQRGDEVLLSATLVKVEDGLGHYELVARTQTGAPLASGNARVAARTPCA